MSITTHLESPRAARSPACQRQQHSHNFLLLNAHLRYNDRIMTAFSWPISVCLASLIFLVFFVLRFQKEISRFIDRTKRITKEGVEAGTTAIATQEVTDIAKPSPADELLQSFDNQLLVEQEGLIRGYLEQKKIQNPPERERVLTRYLASSYIVQKIESIYRSIRGSQHRDMQLINETLTH